MDLKKIFPLAAYGSLAGMLYSLVLFGIFWPSILAGASAGLLLALAYCAIEYFLQAPAAKNLSFKNLLLARGSAYSGLLALGLFMVFALSVIGNERFPGSQEEKLLVFGDWLRKGTWLLILSYSILAGFTSQLVFMLAGVKGMHSIQGFWTGKYRKPVEEERIFMVIGFVSADNTVDINLRNKILVLREILADIQPLIEHSKAELYRIEEDAIILNWQQYPDAQWESCISLFWTAAEMIGKQKSKYYGRFSYYPLLKASLHYDTVLVTEIGVENRELLYSGSGIQFARESLKLCSPERSSIIVSERFLKFLPDQQILAGAVDAGFIQENSANAGTCRLLKPLLHNN